MRAGTWKTVSIASGGTTSAELDLGREFELVQVYSPAIDNATLTVKVSRVNGDTAVQAYTTNDGATGDFVHTTTLKTAAAMNILRIMAQFITLVLSAAQTGGARTFYVRGIDPL